MCPLYTPPGRATSARLVQGGAARHDGRMATLTTARMTGRPVTGADAGHARAIFGTPAVTDWTSPPGSVWDDGRCAAAGLRMAAHWQAHGWGPRLWFAGDRLVGIAGLQFAILDGAGAVELAYAVLPGERGRGFATEAVAAVLAEAPGIAHRVGAAVRRDNAPSRRLLTRAGFVLLREIVEDARAILLLERVTA